MQENVFIHEKLRQEPKFVVLVLGKHVTYRGTLKQPEIITLLLYVINSNFSNWIFDCSIKIVPNWIN